MFDRVVESIAVKCEGLHMECGIVDRNKVDSLLGYGETCNLFNRHTFLKLFH